jgi:RNA polymerase sporulation-specific sigma factor
MVTLEDKARVEENLPLVHSIARRFNGRGVDYEDLFQSGCVGLIKAINNYDEGRGYAFSTYAVPVIMGEIRLLFRDGGAVKISRSLKDKSIKASRIREAFLNTEQREPTLSELASRLGCDLNEAAEIINISNPVVSIDGADEEGRQALDIPYDESEELFNRLAVNQLVSTLGDDERRLVNLRYYKGLTQAQTASILGTSQVQISRKEKRILQKLRNIYNC